MFGSWQRQKMVEETEKKVEENWKDVINDHCTLKPLSLIRHILKLFKTPNPQVLVDTFAGSGTILMIAKELEIEFIGSEISQEYCEIAEKRLSVYSTEDKTLEDSQLTLEL